MRRHQAFALAPVPWNCAKSFRLDTEKERQLVLLFLAVAD